MIFHVAFSVGSDKELSRRTGGVWRNTVLIWERCMSLMPHTSSSTPVFFFLTFTWIAPLFYCLQHRQLLGGRLFWLYVFIPWPGVGSLCAAQCTMDLCSQYSTCIPPGSDFSWKKWHGSPLVFFFYTYLSIYSFNMHAHFNFLFPLQE